ncbi:hypothetical protein E0Z10_g2022 [Xylaria hypoxylon]|uniref:SnoaL-like domain-containing protein n=1 Tax=Xylaria hypoxylon TaxID=37992 RepID=A0A4Z0ZDB0_9PEZI|nr:hypothetical protein E0Z10_g2022 [Xylaria hypoxylon]
MSATSPNEATDNKAVHFEDPVELLRYLYADLTRLSQVASPDIVLHCSDHTTSLRGIAAAQAHEEALVAATGGTLHMDVKSVTMDGELRGVRGFMRARKPGLEDLEAQFYGLWRFENGKPVEHFENIIGDTMKVVRWFGAASA